MISLHDALDYEINASYWAKYISWHFTKRIAAKYFARKVGAKYRRYVANKAIATLVEKL